MTRPACHRCNKPEGVKLRRLINVGGATMIAWRCMDCDCWAESPMHWIKHETVREIIGQRFALDDIPVFEDYRSTCDICGKPGAQLHHFLPQALAQHEEVFSDWRQWCKFQSYLCQYHHDLWHDLVTPWMPGRGNSRKISA